MKKKKKKKKPKIKKARNWHAVAAHFRNSAGPIKKKDKRKKHKGSKNEQEGDY